MGKAQLGVQAALISCLISATAAAQVPSVKVVSAMRDHQDNVGKVLTREINANDCLNEDLLQLYLELSDYSSYALEVWAGSGCDAAVNRLSGVDPCWRLDSAQPDSPTYTIGLPIREILQGRTLARQSLGGAVPSASVACTNADPSIEPQTLTLFVMLLDANAAVVASDTWKIFYRLNGSAPPAQVSASSAEGKLRVDFAWGSDADSWLNGTLFFCEPAPNDPDAGTNTEDAGAVPECVVSSELIPGAPAAPLQHLRCGSAYKDATSGFTDQLASGVAYNVALATMDTYHNIGPLSPVACAVPGTSKSADASSSACSFVPRSAFQAGPVLAWLAAIGALLAGRRWRSGAQPR